jgi:hypothetical protein
MSLKDIQCTCPDCGAEFSLDRAINEQALAKVQAEISKLSDMEIQKKIDSATETAIKKGKEIAQEQMLEKTKEAANELNATKDELAALKLQKVEIETEKKRLETTQQTAIALELARQKNEIETKQDLEKRQLMLQIETLKNDVKKASDRAEQGSMQAQGEAGELLIEDTLRRMFPHDDISEIKKGARGADCLLSVKNNVGRTVGKINIEAKDAKNFSNAWVKKLKDDSLSIGANFSVLITTIWPSDNQKAHMKDGVWICGYADYQILIQALRNTLFELSRAVAAEGAREEKAHVMYDFLTGQEFAATIEQMISPIVRMREQLDKEKRAFAIQWKERETLINGCLDGAGNLYGKIQGIARVNLPSISGLDSLEALGHEVLDEEVNNDS